MNMNKLLTTLLALCWLMPAGALTVKVTNNSSKPCTDYPVVVPLTSATAVTTALVTCNGQEVPCQLDDTDLDGRYDELFFLADLNGKEKKTYDVNLSGSGAPRTYPSRVYTEMVMRNDKVKEKNKQNNYVESLTVRGDCANSYNLLHHHGVCFESELNGIRIYFDKRQTLDLYGKFKKGLELQATQFYTSDEQKQEGYGDDVLWVGNTFGLGAMRGFDTKERQPTMIEPVKSRTQRVVSYGPLRTIVEVIDLGWQPDSLQAPIDMRIRYTQYAGHRDTDVDVFFGSNPSAHWLSTGIINVKGSTDYSDHHGLRACWGTDYPSTDHTKWKPETVGLAILLPKAWIAEELPANTDNYAFVLRGHEQKLSYKVAYCSANEEFGFHSADEWFEWVKAWGKEQNSHQVSVVVE